MVFVPQWEGPTKNCMSDHFRQRYFEIHTTAQLTCSKPKMMNYLNMAMVWAKIVLHKDMGWGTIYRKNVNCLSRDIWMIPTNWIGSSNYWPWWSNQTSNDINYGVPTIIGPHKRPSHGYGYNPYHTIGNDLSQTFSMAHEEGSHGYDYNPYYTFRNDPLPMFNITHEGPNHGYEYNPYRTAPLGAILPQYLLWRMKGQITAMTIIRKIQLATSFLPHSL
jgi:hypothetical protein